MPDIVTHTTFALDVLKNLKHDKLKLILNKHRKIYYLGAQGPDVFFFYKMLSLIKDKNYYKFGNYMHNNKVKHFILTSIGYLKENYYDELLSYVCGFICHHALDSYAHPYVYYVTGFERGNHLRLERAIDSWFIQNYWQRPPHLFKISKELLSSKINKKIFIPFFDKVIFKVFSKSHGGKVFINSLKNYRRYVKFTYDPYGIKKKFASFIDKYFNRKGKFVFETIFYYNNYNEKIDYLNQKNNTWLNPVDEKLESNMSFLELYDRALIEAKEKIDLLYDYINKIVDIDSLDRVIQDKSYSTGLLCSENRKMRNFKVIFNKE
ncbi:MAG TPA: zinc dependent phospholipase C family protein [Haloplasmataceae bacterium]